MAMLGGSRRGGKSTRCSQIPRTTSPCRSARSKGGVAYAKPKTRVRGTRFGLRVAIVVVGQHSKADHRHRLQILEVPCFVIEREAIAQPAKRVIQPTGWHQGKATHPRARFTESSAKSSAEKFMV